ncbi:peptidoglycan-binding protein [Ancylobacter sp. MQZ15Z-1]|uniref:Peptidoglycan-binding protein n=1 Tax=Ancylobacter mangrovi TaxID=2972472 RepID=A0A9X2PD58_9HYPH|nr:peptidoglycan-binding protein [Ancylobacter mangrovi]MCS0493800.1 peptidoglycan-binding protein [Ancylobacter mangrovi]
MSILKKGLAGTPVKILQEKLGVPADGRFGPQTEEALKAYQKEHGLGTDGIAGPDTFASLGLYELVLLKVGSSGETVKKLQSALGIATDGKFGAGTAKAVKTYQAANGLEADGFAGPATLAKLAVFTEITPAVISKSQIDPGAAPAPQAPDETPVAEAAEAPPKSIWATIKGFFS